MRRTALRFVLGGWLVLALLGGIGALWGLSRLGADVAPPGVEELQIERRALLKTRVLFRLPPDQTRSDLLQFLQQHGWQRLRGFGTEQDSFLLVRRPWSGRMRDVLLVTPDPHDRRRFELFFGRCVWVYRMGCVS